MTGLEKFIGEVLDGKYRLERLLGQGGMGAVYLATHLGTERPVALKLIAPQFMRNSEFVERFKREARAAGRLRHPNVVDVTDFGFAESGGERVAYLVMEYLDGCTLGDVLAEEKRLPLDWTVDILEQVCSAVEEAHQQGIVHRDLKPDNIWLEPNRLGGYRVKVLDFGIAKLGAGGADDPRYQSGTRDAAQFAPTVAPQASTERHAQSPLDAVQASIARAASSLRAPSKPPDSAGRDEDEQGTRLFTPATDEEHGTRLFSPPPPPRDVRDAADEEPGTLLFSPKDDAASDARANGGGQGAQSEEHGAQQIDASRATHHAHDPRATQLADEADGTRLFAAAPDAQQTRPARQARFSDRGPDDPAPTAVAAASALTRVGSIMGTPLYMSPEQCRGQRLDSRADIYSLGVIAYQMLAGETPFTGDMVSVMRQHMDAQPVPVRERNKNVPKRTARLVMSALSKDPAGRPPSAAAFANSLRAGVGGLGNLLQRAFALYSEHFPVFLKLSLLAHVPFIVVSALMFLVDVFDLEHRLPQTLLFGRVKVPLAFIAVILVLALLQFVANFLGTSVISGVTAIIVTQLQLAPLRPVRLRAALAVLRRRWRPFLNTSVRVTARIFIGFCLLFVPAFVMMVKYAFYAPVVLLEGLEKKAARERSNELSKRARRMVVGLYLINFMIPVLVGWLVGGLKLQAGHTGAHITTKASPHLVQLVNIIIVPLISITTALLYLKLRRLGGETMRETLEQFDDPEAPRARWQQRMRERLSGYTPRPRTSQSSDQSKVV